METLEDLRRHIQYDTRPEWTDVWDSEIYVGTSEMFMTKKNFWSNRLIIVLVLSMKCL